MKIGKGRNVLLVDESGRKYLLQVTGQMEKVEGLGVIDTKRLASCSYGDTFSIGNRHFFLLEPSVADKVARIRRKAQIILPKDSAAIIVRCNIRSGSIVVEGGIGSGALTIVLASYVAPDGKVISYELRDDFACVALENIRRANLESLVEVRMKDIRKGIMENDVDAVVLDIPDPWEAVTAAKKALKVGGYICSYSPTVNQLERTVRKLEEEGFQEIRSVEILEREMLVGEGGVHPSFEMLAHTGYLTFARKYRR